MFIPESFHNNTPSRASASASRSNSELQAGYMLAAQTKAENERVIQEIKKAAQEIQAENERLKKAVEELQAQSEEYKAQQELIESQNAVTVRMVMSGSGDKKTEEQRRRQAEKDELIQEKRRQAKEVRKARAQQRRDARQDQRERQAKYDAFAEDMMQKLEQELAEYSAKINSGMKGEGKYSKNIHRIAKNARLDFLSNMIRGGISMAEMDERGLPGPFQFDWEAMTLKNEALKEETDKDYEEACAKSKYYQSPELLKGVDTHPTKIMTWEGYSTVAPDNKEIRWHRFLRMEDNPTNTVRQREAEIVTSNSEEEEEEEEEEDSSSEEEEDDDDDYIPEVYRQFAETRNTGPSKNETQAHQVKEAATKNAYRPVNSGNSAPSSARATTMTTSNRPVNSGSSAPPVARTTTTTTSDTTTVPMTMDTIKAKLRKNQLLNKAEQSFLALHYDFEDDEEEEPESGDKDKKKSQSNSNSNRNMEVEKANKHNEKLSLNPERSRHYSGGNSSSSAISAAQQAREELKASGYEGYDSEEIDR
jgi:hypothetical protein